jgi:CelD/BcsL family acetyltransferase involved in cellulose biosynthesis
VGALHAMAAHGRAYAYLSGLDPAWARFSPGSVLLLQLVEDAVAEGLLELDLLRGREPYKYRLGAEDRFNWRLSLEAVDFPRGEAIPGAAG